ncbi:MAG: hypothetical protein ACFFDB_20385 [Promethearchaeota archaeon]
MYDNDYIVKVVLTGDNAEGKQRLASRFSKNLFKSDTKSTIGVEFHVKSLSILGKRMKIQLWELGNDARLKPLAFSYFRGAMGAIIMPDISKADFRYNLEDTIQFIIEQAGDIPIILITFNPQSEAFRFLAGFEVMLTADQYSSSILSNLTSKPILKSTDILYKLGEHIITRSEISPSPKPLQQLRKTRTEFVINKYLSLRLEYGNTNIYVGRKLFKQCKYLLLDIPLKDTKNYSKIDSIDEAFEKLDRSLERGKPRKYHITPDIEFWGHCSNLQTWYENNYDTRILHSNLAFPLLMALAKTGDPLAKKVFKEEITLRLISGYPSVIRYLINENYLKYFNKEELDLLLGDFTFIKNLPKWFNEFKDIPKWLLKRIKAKLKELRCLYCDSKISTHSIKQFLQGKSIKCEYCYSTII